MLHTVRPSPGPASCADASRHDAQMARVSRPRSSDASSRGSTRRPAARGIWMSAALVLVLTVHAQSIGADAQDMQASASAASSGLLPWCLLQLESALVRCASSSNDA